MKTDRPTFQSPPTDVPASDDSRRTLKIIQARNGWLVRGPLGPYIFATLTDAFAYVTKYFDDLGTR